MKISIITPTYNSAKTILYNLESVSNQTYKNIEHIIVDNFSSDETKEIIKKYKNKNLRFYQKKTNMFYMMVDTIHFYIIYKKKISQLYLLGEKK